MTLIELRLHLGCTLPLILTWQCPADWLFDRHVATPLLRLPLQEDVAKALEDQNAKAEEATAAIAAAAAARSEAEARVQSLQRQLDATVFQIRQLAEQGQTPLTEESKLQLI